MEIFFKNFSSYKLIFYYLLHSLQIYVVHLSERFSGIKSKVLNFISQYKKIIKVLTYKIDCT